MSSDMPDGIMGETYAAMPDGIMGETYAAMSATMLGVAEIATA